MTLDVTLVTLAVSDVARSERYYTELGFELVVSEGDFRLFRGSGSWLALYPPLAEDAKADVRVALAANLDSAEAVDAAVAAALAAGATMLAAPERKEWGGYSGYVADPDGHAWEIAWNPDWPYA